MYKISFYDKIGNDPLWIEVEEKEFRETNIKEIIETLMQEESLTTQSKKGYAIGVNLKNIVYITVERT